MNEGVSLNGEWQVQWGPVAAEAWTREPGRDWRSGVVPGDVHLDLIHNGLLNEPLERACAFEDGDVEGRLWIYRRTFDFRRPASPFRARLIFAGLDGIAEVRLNDRLLGRTENAFVAHGFDVAGTLVDGANTLLVRITNGLETLAGREMKKYAVTDEAGRRVWLRKPQFSFGWDWAPRLVTCGIWRDVRLHTTTTGFVDELYARPVFSGDRRRAVVHWSFRFAPVDAPDAPAYAEVSILRNGKVVAASPVAFRKGLVKGRLEVVHPDLWWPTGYGEQALYEIRVVPGGEGEPAAETRFGIRQVKLVQRSVKAGGKTFAFKINGKTVYCRGANWVPADSIPARVADAKIDRLIEEARACHFNMLRVWGGGIYECRRFYERCDALGILIWQDFMYACGLYPDDDPDFFRNCVGEAETAVKALRNHPCIAVWCGNNEIHDGWDDVYRNMDGVDAFYGSRLWDQALPRLVKRLVPGAVYRPASPYSGAFHRSDQEGDCHCLLQGLTPEDATDIRIGVESTGRFNSEWYTWCSPPAMESIRRYLPEAGRTCFSNAYRYHANTDFEVRERRVAMRYITERPEDLPLPIYVGAMQRLHGEHSAAVADAHRRNIAIASGSLFWMYNDCWPTSGWTTHDYYLRRKALFYYMKRAFAPVVVSFRTEDSGLSVWVSNLGPHTFHGTVRYGRYAFPDGKPVREQEEPVAVKSHASVKVAFFHTTLAWPWESLASFAYVSLSDAQRACVSKAVRMFATYKGLSGETFSFPPRYWEARSLQTPRIRVDPAGDGVLSVTTDVPAFSIALDVDDGLPDDNYFDLMPGEAKTVRLAAALPRGNAGTSSLNDIILFLRRRKGGR